MLNVFRIRGPRPKLRQATWIHIVRWNDWLVTTILNSIRQQHTSYMSDSQTKQSGVKHMTITMLELKLPWEERIEVIFGQKLSKYQTVVEECVDNSWTGKGSRKMCLQFVQWETWTWLTFRSLVTDCSDSHTTSLLKTEEFYSVKIH